MSNAPLCPMKSVLAAAVIQGARVSIEDLDMACAGEYCAWYSKGKEVCAIKSIAMAQWAAVDAIRDHMPEQKQ